MSKFSERLRELRKSRDWSQEVLAQKLHTSRSRVSMYEQGRREPDFEMLESIADLFNVTQSYLDNSIDYIVPLNNDEKELIEIYRASDDAFRQRIMEYCKMLTVYEQNNNK